MVSLLIKAGADVNKKCVKRGFGPLSWAAMKGHENKSTGESWRFHENDYQRVCKSYENFLVSNPNESSSSRAFKKMWGRTQPNGKPHILFSLFILQCTQDVKKYQETSKPHKKWRLRQRIWEKLFFSYYQDDLRKIFDEAIIVRDESAIINSRLNSIFHRYFPKILITKLAANLTPEDLPVTGHFWL